MGSRGMAIRGGFKEYKYHTIMRCGLVRFIVQNEGRPVKLPEESRTVKELGDRRTLEEKAKDEEKKMKKQRQKKEPKLLYPPKSKLDEAIRELYYDILSEADYYVNGYYYHFIMDDVAGWNVYIEDDNRANKSTEHWFDVSPHEHFETRMDLITKFHIWNDGCTFLEYTCDECGEPRPLIVPPPEDHQEGSKYN